MRRTTIFLPDDLHERLRAEAFRSRISMAELIRLRLDRRRARVRKPIEDPLAKVEGIARDGRLSQGIDEALYSR
jgi:hypothetical protein